MKWVALLLYCIQILLVSCHYITIVIIIFNSYSEEEEEERVGVYIGEMPISPDHNYFEIEILDMGAQGAICIGEYPRDRHFPS